MMTEPTNGEAVATFVERCRTMTPTQATRLAATAAWDAARGAALDAARGAADAAWGAADAAVAIVVRDRITPEQYAVLVRPFVDAGLEEWVK